MYNEDDCQKTISTDESQGEIDQELHGLSNNIDTLANFLDQLEVRLNSVLRHEPVGEGVTETAQQRKTDLSEFLHSNNARLRSFNSQIMSMIERLEL